MIQKKWEKKVAEPKVMNEKLMLKVNGNIYEVHGDANEIKRLATGNLA